MGIESYERYKTAHVLVGTPNYTNLLSSEVHANHMECAVAWTKWGLKFNWTLVGRSFVHFARTQICQAAVAGGFTHVLWLDDDAIVNPEVLPRFIEHDKDIMIAPYPMRKPAFEIGVLTSTNGDFHDHASYRNMTTADLGKGIVQVDGGGTHCMLVKVETFTKKGGGEDHPISMPPQLKALLGTLTDEQRDVIDHYLGDIPNESLSLQEEDSLGKPYFMMPKQGTEDMYFCYRAKRKGLEVWCDTDVFADHMGFAPRVTLAFRQHFEKTELAGQVPTPVDDNVIILQPPGIGRNHAGIKKDEEVNLV